MYYGYIWLDHVEKYILSALWSNISVRVFRKKLFQKVPKGRKISDLPRRDKTPYQAQALTGKPFVTVLPLFVSDHSGCLARHLWQTELFKKSLREKSDCFKQLNAFFLLFFFAGITRTHARAIKRRDRGGDAGTRNGNNWVDHLLTRRHTDTAVCSCSACSTNYNKILLIIARHKYGIGTGMGTGMGTGTGTSNAVRWLETLTSLHGIAHGPSLPHRYKSLANCLVNYDKKLSLSPYGDSVKRVSWVTCAGEEKRLYCLQSYLNRMCSIVSFLYGMKIICTCCWGNCLTGGNIVYYICILLLNNYF